MTIVSSELVVSIAFGLGATILSIFAVLATLRQRYIRIQGKSNDPIKQPMDHILSQCAHVTGNEDAEAQLENRDSSDHGLDIAVAPQRLEAIRLLEIVSQLVSRPDTSPRVPTAVGD